MNDGAIISIYDSGRFLIPVSFVNSYHPPFHNYLISIFYHLFNLPRFIATGCTAKSSSENNEQTVQNKNDDDDDDVTTITATSTISCTCSYISTSSSSSSCCSIHHVSVSVGIVSDDDTTR